jgi:hypothetical protein
MCCFAMVLLSLTRLNRRYIIDSDEKSLRRLGSNGSDDTFAVAFPSLSLALSPLVDGRVAHSWWSSGGYDII